MDERRQFDFEVYSKFELVHVKDFQPPEYDEDIELCEYSKRLLSDLNITLYKHQAQAIRKFWMGKNVAIVTPTASGKTLPYVISYLEELYKDDKSCALYIAPINALINDQTKKIRDYIKRVTPWVEVNSLTSATPDNLRAKLKNQGGFILTNPEMLIYSLVLYNKGWSSFWKNVKLIVVDEVHEMSGIKGSHFGNIMRVVNMLNDIYENNARYFALSGTISNPKEFIEKIFGKVFEIIDKNTSGSKRIEYLVPNSIYQYSVGPLRKIQDIFQMFSDKSSKKTLVFVRSRKEVERIAKIIRNIPLGKIVSPYRSGYSPNDRIAIENMFKDGKLKGLVATSAFEMGIDIGDLDVVCVFGFPSSRISLRQRFGRTGRIRDGIAIFLPSSNMLDNYYYNNPKELFSEEVESLTANIFNDRIIGYYIAAAIIAYNDATEAGKNYIPEDIVLKYWGEESIYSIEKFSKSNPNFVSISYNTYDNKKYFFTSVGKNDIRSTLNIRGAGKILNIYNRETNKKIGEIGINYVFSECHPGGVYMHMGNSYLVEELDISNNLVVVIPTREDISTEVLFDKDIDILSTLKVKTFKGFKLSLSRLNVREIYTGYLVVEYRQKNVKGEFITERIVKNRVDYKDPYIFEYETDGIVVEFNPTQFRDLLKFDEDYKILKNNLSFQNLRINEPNILRSGLHAAEHSIIAMYPSEVICSRSEIGGLSILEDVPRIIIYEGIEGGVGYSEIAFDKFENIVRRALFGIRGCKCRIDSGCPACIQSPKCGNANSLLSKHMGNKVLSFILDAIKYPLDEKGDLPSKVVNYSISYVRSELPKVEENGKYAQYDLLKFPLENFRKPVVFDLETQLYSYEVGGWDNAKDMLLSVGVVYDIKEDKMLIFNESNVNSLISLLLSSDLVIGYNTKEFDYKVLSRYDKRFDYINNVKTFDILNDLIKKHVGNNVRISLDNLIRNNINPEGKKTNSVNMPAYFREGKIDLVIEHCKQDVYYTYMIMKKILRDKYLRYEYNNAIFTIEFQEVIFRFKL
ncbi:MAG: DEAD/DEAH box helicase [Brevinematia bacterium]